MGLPKLRALRISEDTLVDFLNVTVERRIFAPASVDGTCSIARRIDAALQELEVFVSPAEPKYRLHPLFITELIQWLRDRCGTGITVRLSPVLFAGRLYEAALFEWSKHDIYRQISRELLKEFESSSV